MRFDCPHSQVPAATRVLVASITMFVVLAALSLAPRVLTARAEAAAWTAVQTPQHPEPASHGAARAARARRQPGRPGRVASHSDDDHAGRSGAPRRPLHRPARRGEPMTNRAAALRYARALFDVAKKESDVEQVQQQLEAF